MYDVVIMGAGVIGSVVARELSKYEMKIVVLEKEDDVCTGTSKANSGIVHAGFDGKPGMLKATLNVLGNAMYDDLANELDFPFKRNGSLVVCFDPQDLHVLQKLKDQGEQNGVLGLAIIDRNTLRRLEPNVAKTAVAALLAPSGGIVDPFKMTIALAENAYVNGVEFKFNHQIKRIEKRDDHYRVLTDADEYHSKVIINATGVFSDVFNNMVSDNKIRITARRGEYCLFDKNVGELVSHTIFQLPGKLGKGILVTPTVDGNLLIGPNAVDSEDKQDVGTTREGLEEILLKAGQSVEMLPIHSIITSFAGLRAIEDKDDFVIGEAPDAPGFINVAGIQSPGLSSAPAIGKMVAEIVTAKIRPVMKVNFKRIRKDIVRFNQLSNAERMTLIQSRPEYGKIVCRCEMVTEAEIIDAIHRPLGATTLDGLKRRIRAGAGRCQAGFCTPRMVEILARECNLEAIEVTRGGAHSYILVGKNKEAIHGS